MPGRIFFLNILRTLEPSSSAGWINRHRLTDEDPKLCATATGYASSDYALIYDFGSARSGGGAAVVNHNLRSLSFTTFTVKTGSTDNGTTWDEIQLTVSSLATSGYTPSFAGKFPGGGVVKRYWRFGFQSSASAADVLSIGQLCLFTGIGDLPTAPSTPRQLSGRDTAAIDRGLGGYEARHDVGVGSLQRQLRWKDERGGRQYWDVRDIIRRARQLSQWGFEPVCWVPHDAEKPNPSYDAHPCAYCVFEGVADSEVYHVGSIRHYDVALRLRELSFDGLL